MARKMISLKIDPELLEAARRAARQERRSVSNLIEVALEQYLSRRRATAVARWKLATDGAYEARVGRYRLVAWHDTQGAREDWGWAWRVVGPSGLDEAAGTADSLADAQRQAEDALPVYVYWHQDGEEPVREAGPMSLAEARAYIWSRAVDEHGNLSDEEDCPYLYVADSEGKPLED